MSKKLTSAVYLKWSNQTLTIVLKKINIFKSITNMLSVSAGTVSFVGNVKHGTYMNHFKLSYHIDTESLNMTNARLLGVLTVSLIVENIRYRKRKKV